LFGIVRAAGLQRNPSSLLYHASNTRRRLCVLAYPAFVFMTRGVCAYERNAALRCACALRRLRVRCARNALARWRSVFWRACARTRLPLHYLLNGCCAASGLYGGFLRCWRCFCARYSTYIACFGSFSW